MKKILLTLAIMLVGTSSAFAAQVGSEYLDIAPTDGQVDTIKVEFDENVTACTYEAGDWGINTAGSINVTAVTGLSCTGADHFLEINVTADVRVTGGATAPQITYTDNGTAGSLTMTSGASGALAINPVDKAAPVVITMSPMPNHDDEIHVDEESTKDAIHGIVDILLTEDIVGMTNPGADNGAFSVWGSDNHMYFEFRDRDDGDPRPDVDIPSDVNTDGTYELAYNFIDSAMNQSYLESFKIVLDNVDEAPVPVSGFVPVSVDENQTAVATLVATDPEGAAVTYFLDRAPGVLGDGLDNDRFSLDSTTGVLKFITAPDFENPTDRSFLLTPPDNNYQVTIRVSDGVNNVYQRITVTVTDVNETKGHSGKSTKTKSAKKVCKDSLATNFSNVGQHDASLCEYDSNEDKKEKKIGDDRLAKNEDKKEKKIGDDRLAKCSYSYSKMIRKGMRGDKVKELQETLNQLGFNTGVVDGIYGPKTMAGIKAFQKAMGITADGIFGPQSNSKLSVKCEM